MDPSLGARAARAMWRTSTGVAQAHQWPPRSGPSAENFAMVARVEGGPRGGVSRRAVDPPKQRAQSLQRRSGLLGAKNGRAGAVRERLGVRPLVGGMPRR